MKLKFLVDEDFVNYRKPSMFIGFPRCSFKCGAENCQNFCLAKEPDIEIDTDDVIARFMENPITEAVVLGGLEPFDSWPEVEYFIMKKLNLVFNNFLLNLFITSYSSIIIYLAIFLPIYNIIGENMIVSISLLVVDFV